METVVECFVTDEIVLDKLAFNEWVAGRTAADAARQKEKELAKWLLNAQPPHRIANAFDPKWVMSRKINMQECAEQFQLYEWITPALNEPTQFHTQSLFVLQPADVAYMIETYYSYDEGVMRDLLGKSLTKAAIRDIQDQAEILGTKVNSTRRQFDNLKRILTRIEQHMLEKKSAGNKSAPASRSILSVIMQDFKLSIELAAQYQHIAFLCYNKIETSKSRLNVLDFTEWSALAGVVMAKWGTEDALDFDSSFTDMMRHAKETLMDRELANDLRKHVMALFRTSLHESPEPPSMAALGKEQLFYRHMLSGVARNPRSVCRRQRESPCTSRCLRLVTGAGGDIIGSNGQGPGDQRHLHKVKSQAASAVGRSVAKVRGRYQACRCHCVSENLRPTCLKKARFRASYPHSRSGILAETAEL